MAEQPVNLPTAIYLGVFSRAEQRVLASDLQGNYGRWRQMCRYPRNARPRLEHQQANHAQCDRPSGRNRPSRKDRAPLLFDRVARRAAPGAALVRTAPFVAGYLLVWGAFSVAATALQVELIAAGWIDEMGVSARPWLTAALLAGVGTYQWLPAKRACLDHCRSPVQFLVEAYRPGASGALVMGVRHGLYCLGCCWALMLLLFVGGVMNLLWVALIAAVVFVEKLLARGEWLRRAIGLAALGAALVVVIRHLAS